MSHHQGMAFVSIANALLGPVMQRRFESDPSLQATALLLQERVPKAMPVFPHASKATVLRGGEDLREALMRVFDTPDTAMPEVHLLSNGRLSVMVTNTGSGYMRWKDIAVTRWREDTTLDNYGMFCYLRNIDTGDEWSVGYQPTLNESNSYEAIFTQARAEFRRRDGAIDTHAEIAVSPEDDIELRRITISNRSRYEATIELTSYAEVVASPGIRRRGAPGFLEPLRGDRDSQRPAGAALHAARAVGPGAAAVDAAHDGGARHGTGRTVVRDRPREVRGPHANGRRSGSDGLAVRPLRKRGAGARPDRGHSPEGSDSSRPERARGHSLRSGRDARGRRVAVGEVS